MLETAFGVHYALPGIFEVGGGHGIAVAPFGVAQVEGIGKTILGYFVALGQRGLGLTVFIQTEEAVHQQGHNAGRITVAGITAVHGVHFGNGLRAYGHNQYEGQRQDPGKLVFHANHPSCISYSSGPFSLAGRDDVDYYMHTRLKKPIPF